MSFKPIPLTDIRLDDAVLTKDKRLCRKIGPCGIGKQALYLNSFFIDRRYYIPFTAITRVFKRVAMSRGGFSGKGLFATMSYLVVEFEDGKQKQCNFKYEYEVDELLQAMRLEHPQIPCVSAAAEKRLEEERAQREAEERSRPPLTKAAAQAVDTLDAATAFLEQRPELSEHLSSAAKRKRNYQCSSASYRWAAMAITLLGIAALVFGAVSLLQHHSFAIYFALFGLAAIFLFSGFSVLPTARNNRKAILRNDAEAQKNMQSYLTSYSGFPLPARYAHPVVLLRMKRAILDGRAANPAEALAVVKTDLKALNADVQVSRQEYDEVIAIKPMFLNADYQ